MFSHYGEFDDLLAEAMGDNIVHHDRSSFIRIADTWVPYPFQHNLHRLPAELAETRCRSDSSKRRPRLAPLMVPAPRIDRTSASPIDATFGPAIVDMFMRPYI